MGKSDMENFEKHKIFWNMVLLQMCDREHVEDKDFLKWSFSVNSKAFLSLRVSFPVLVFSDVVPNQNKCKHLKSYVKYSFCLSHNLHLTIHSSL